VIVTLAPASSERWANIRDALTFTYVVRDVGAFPLSSLGLRCIVFQVPEDRSVDEVIARLAADPLVESPSLPVVRVGPCKFRPDWCAWACSRHLPDLIMREAEALANLM
jgi:hypothetical protein